MTVSFIGHGYVGLVTAAVFADLGNTVWVVGRTKEKIEALKKGNPLIYEPGLEEVLKRNLKAGRIRFTLAYDEAIPASDIVFISVGTPSKKGGEADLTSVFSVAEKIGTHLDGYTVVATKSTVPPGTNRNIAKIINQEKSRKATFDMASVPEFLREGTAISDTLHPDRVVLGVESDRALQRMLAVHEPINGERVIANIETAELIKYASNAFLSTKISFANALAFISERVGADVERVLDGVGLDRRIGRRFLYPGVGYGGSCFPKDVKALIVISDGAGYEFSLLKQVDHVNAQATAFFVKKIKKHFDTHPRGKTVAILGLSFKPNTDDMRDAPSIQVISALLKHGLSIKAYDPVAADNARHILPKSVQFAADAYAAADNADAVVVVTEWNEFRQIDLKRLGKKMRDPVLFDGRNIYNRKKAEQAGFRAYYSVGRAD